VATLHLLIHAIVRFNLGATADSTSRTLAASLIPLVVDGCEGRIEQIVWFKTDWQRGGAATAKALWRRDDGGRDAVVLKLPVVQRELEWMQRLQHRPDGDTVLEAVVPRLFAGSQSLGGYDLAWMVIEQLPHGPLGLRWHDEHIRRLTMAAARFHFAVSRHPVDQVPTAEPWMQEFVDAAESAKVNQINHRQRWNMALKSLRHRGEQLVHEWNERDEDQWCHGDLHLANAMCREEGETCPVCLIDLADVHAGHWVEDAVYLERQLWGRPDRLKAQKPVKELASARKQLGLTVDPEYPRLAMIRRAFLAGTAPKFIKSEGHPVYLDACLEKLEAALVDLK